MAVLDILQKMFGQSPVAAPQTAAPTGDPSQSPIMQFLQQAGLNAPIDPQEEQRRAISRGLLDFGKAMSSSTQDFLPALAGSIGEGAGGYLDTKDASAEKKRTQNQDLMKQIFGLAGQEATGQYRNDMLDQRAAAADQRNETTNARIDELVRHNTTTEAHNADKIDIYKLLGISKLDQGDTKLEQGQQRLDQYGNVIDETKRHNTATEGQNQEKIDIAKDPVLRKAKLDKYQAEIDRLNRANGGTTGSSSYPAARSKAAQAILKMEEEESFGIDSNASQEQQDAAKARIAEKAKHILDLYGVSGNSSIQNKDDGQPTAQPEKSSKQSSVPEGTTATNPATGQKMIRKGGKWIPVS